MTGTPAAAVETDDLHKRYDKLTALSGVSLSIQPGEIFALLGPNGAGKTTWISIVCGLVRPTAGRAEVLGHDVVRDSLAARRQGIPDHVVSQHLRPSGRGADEPADDRDPGGLARAVRSEEREDLARLDAQRQTAQRLDARVALGEVGRLDGGRARCR